MCGGDEAREGERIWELWARSVLQILSKTLGFQ
jgi:hypothetical protein